MIKNSTPVNQLSDNNDGSFYLCQPKMLDAVCMKSNYYWNCIRIPDRSGPGSLRRKTATFKKFGRPAILMSYWRFKHESRSCEHCAKLCRIQNPISTIN